MEWNKYRDISLAESSGSMNQDWICSVNLASTNPVRCDLRVSQIESPRQFHLYVCSMGMLVLPMQWRYFWEEVESTGSRFLEDAITSISGRSGIVVINGLMAIPPESVGVLLKFTAKCSDYRRLTVC